MLSATLLVIFWVTEQKFAPRTERGGVIQSLKIAGRNRMFLSVLLITLLAQFSVMTIEPVLPLYIVEIGGSVKDASLLSGIIFSLLGIASILFAPRWGNLADRIGFRKVLIIGLLFGGLGNIAQILFHSIWGFSIVRFIYGAFFCAVFPAINGLVVQSTPSEFRGRAFGINQTANQIGGMLGPIAGGLISGVFSIHSIFWITGFILLFAMVVAFQSYSKDDFANPSKNNPAKTTAAGES